MTSTFGGLETAYTGLTAARDAMSVTGQNITNASTAGYTRQRVEETAAVPAIATQFGTPAATPGEGVTVTGIQRIADELTNARLRSTQAQASFTSTRSDALQQLEDGLGEPSDTGLSGQLSQFWSSWQDLANNPGEPSTAESVIAAGQTVATQISQGYQRVASQWSGLRSQASVLADQVNQAADGIAALNGQIQQALASGSSANELEDQRDQLAQSVAQLVGGTVTTEPDGTASVFVAGNLLVSGQSGSHVQITGADDLQGAAANPVQLEWQSHPGQAIDVDGGQIAATLSLLAPAAADGSGGALAQAAEGYNQVATALATQVNGLEASAVTPSGASGQDFFTLAAGTPAALGLTVTATSSTLAAGAAGAGALDGSVADQISQLGTANGSPDSIWSTLVGATGTASQTAQQQDSAAQASLTSATTAQQSVSSVDTDQENLDLITEQSSYQAAARMLTAVDQVLDTLINHTGLVGISA